MNFLIPIAALAAGTPLAFARQADEFVRVELEITSVAGASHYVDAGRGRGLLEGDRVTFFPANGASVSGTVRAVSKSGARVELDPGSGSLPIRTRGEVRIPASRLAPTPLPVPTPQSPAPTPTPPTAPSTVPENDAPPAAPAHPPWTHPPENWSSDTPLLAPAFGVKPEDRDSLWRGRAWTAFDATMDSERADRKYVLSRTGADVTLENPFGQGGSLRADVEIYHRVDDIDGASDDDTGLQIDRLTYEFGGTTDRPHRFQVGRFLQNEFPELGLLDGVEWSHRSSGGSGTGASIGWIPETKQGRHSFDDLAVALFHRQVFDARERHTLGLALQNTWHAGESDRNLAFAEFETRPSDELSLRAGAWIDLYTSDDVLKDSGLELTELRVDGTWRFASASGLGLFASTQRWPEVLRDEDELVDAETIADGHVERFGAHVWHALSTRLRFTLRGDAWTDQDDEGTTGEAGLSLRDALGLRGDLSAAFFYADGSFSSGPGARVNATQSFGRVLGSLGYEFVDYEQKRVFGSQSQLSQHGLFTTLDFPLGDAWDLSLRGEHRFGDQQDSYAAGFLLQARF